MKPRRFLSLLPSPRPALLAFALLAAAALSAGPARPAPAGPYDDRITAERTEPAARIAGAPAAAAEDGRRAFRVVPAPRSPEPVLPGEARELLQQFEAQQAEARREAEVRVARARQELVGQLQALQDRYTRAGQLDAAVAVRDEVRRLRAGQAGPAAPGTPPSPVTPQADADPGNLTAYRDRVGQSFTFEVTGSTEGTVWGTEVYTDDSALATAAVHAGALRPGQHGVVRVTILPALNHYEGTPCNGVTSTPYGPWYGSYVVESAEPTENAAPGDARRDVYIRGLEHWSDAAAPLPDPGTLSDYRDRVGQTFSFAVTGATEGAVWGDGVYTDDSSLAAAAVHAGVLAPGQQGIVTVTIRPSCDNYPASTRNGVTSRPWGAWGGSYAFVPPAARASR